MAQDPDDLAKKNAAKLEKQRQARQQAMLAQLQANTVKKSLVKAGLDDPAEPKPMQVKDSQALDDVDAIPQRSRATNVSDKKDKVEEKEPKKGKKGFGFFGS